jgi:beta-glucanase (GH16 family)
MERVTAILLLLLFSIASLEAEPGWRIVWRDEFSGPLNTEPDPSKWVYDLGNGGWGNHELEVYTNSRENIFQDGTGNLVIRASKNSSGVLTSARIKTKSKFEVQYGKIEARLKIPRGQGMWPAFWMLGNNIETAGWPRCGEIDVMENIGKEPGIVHGTVHGPGYSGKSGITSKYSPPDALPLSNSFHVYGLEWSPSFVKFFLDGTQYATVTPASLPKDAAWVYDHPFFLLLNLAVGGDWPGTPDESTGFPQTMLADWVRVWQRSKSD